MGQRLIETDCPVCGSRNRLACYGVVAHEREGAIVRYYLCRKCGARVSRGSITTAVTTTGSHGYIAPPPPATSAGSRRAGHGLLALRRRLLWTGSSH